MILILAFFLFRGFEIILKKYDVYSKFEKYSSLNCNSIFLHNLSKCKFCMDHHLAILPTIIIGLLTEFHIVFLIFPIVIASINNLISEHEGNSN